MDRKHPTDSLQYNKLYNTLLAYVQYMDNITQAGVQYMALCNSYSDIEPNHMIVSMILHLYNSLMEQICK